MTLPSQQSGLVRCDLQPFVFSYLTLRNEGGKFLRNVGRHSANGTVSPSPSRHKIMCCAVGDIPKCCEGCQLAVLCQTMLPEHCVLPLNVTVVGGQQKCRTSVEKWLLYRQWVLCPGTVRGRNCQDGRSCRLSHN